MGWGRTVRPATIVCALTVLGATMSAPAATGSTQSVPAANTTATVNQVNSVLVGVISGDTVTLGGTATGTFASANIGTSIVVAVAGFNISGGSSANYSLTQPTTIANITAKLRKLGWGAQMTSPEAVKLAVSEIVAENR